MNRLEFFSLLRNLPPPDLKLVQNAYWYAKNVHRLDRRDSGERYFEHCRRVPLILIQERGIYEARTIATGLTHDSVEDTFAPPDVLLALLGPEVYESVEILSKTTPAFDCLTGLMVARGKKDTELYWEQIVKAPARARLVKCADRLDNLRSFGIWSEERRQRYVAETKRWILPIASATDPWFVVEMAKYL